MSSSDVNDVSKIKDYLISNNRLVLNPNNPLSNPYRNPHPQEISISYFDFTMESESDDDIDYIIFDLKNLGLVYNFKIISSDQPHKTMEELFEKYKPITIISSWNDLYKLYKQTIASWNEVETFQTFENWLQENCEVPQLKK